MFSIFQTQIYGSLTPIFTAFINTNLVVNLFQCRLFPKKRRLILERSKMIDLETFRFGVFYLLLK